MKRSTFDGIVEFFAVAETGGFRAAAARLDVTPSAVSQAIRALEQRVGAPLFQRTTRSVSLTEAGARLLAHARPASELIGAGLAAAADLGGEASGRLRINAPRPSMALLVNRLLPDFLLRYPRIRLELVAEDRLVDIVEGGFDAGIRLGDHLRLDMVAVRLTPPESYVTVASPDFLADRWRPATPSDLRHLPCVELKLHESAANPWIYEVDGTRVSVKVEGPFVANDVDTCVRAALKGVGLFRLPRSIVTRHLAEGALETVLDGFETEMPGLSLYYPSRSQALPKLRAFIDFATERMRRGFAPGDYDATGPGA